MTIKLWSLNDIRKEAASTEMIALQEEYAVLVDIDMRAKRIWLKQKGQENIYEEIDVKRMIKEIAAYLSRHVSLEKLLQDKILHEPAETILDLHKRITRKGEVIEHKGCYYLSIKGKQGKPLELNL